MTRVLLLRKTQAIFEKDNFLVELVLLEEDVGGKSLVKIHTVHRGCTNAKEAVTVCPEPCNPHQVRTVPSFMM